MRIMPGARLLACVFAAIVVPLCSPAWANFIVYSDFMEFQSIEIGGTAHNCTSITDGQCAFIVMIGEADTSGVAPFSVTGASGLTNHSLTAVIITVSFLDPTIPTYFANLDLSVGGLYVSVDQTNGGAGFSSMYGPTYPLATYGGAAFQTYDLASNFSSNGFGPFCPDLNLCTNGALLKATDGTEIIITRGLAPAFSDFSSTVATNPEPTSLALAALALLAGGASLRRQRVAA